MNRQKLVILPKLNDCSGDLSKQWFIYYSARDPRTGKMHRFRHYDGFTGLNSKQRYQHAEEVTEAFRTRLAAGWSPFTDSSQAIYDDQVDYKTVAQMYGTRRGGNRTARPWISAFIKAISPGVSHSTQLTYISKLRIFALWLDREGLGENDLSTFDNKLIGLFFHYLIDDRKLSAISISKYSELLYNLFQYFCKQKLINLNPVYDLPVCNRINDQTPRPIQRPDIEIFKKEVQKDPELWLAVMFMFYCSLRPGHEIREMKIKDIDMLSGTVRVDRTRAKIRVERIVTMPIQLISQLRTMYSLQDYDREFYVFGRGGIPGTLPIGKNKLSRKFRILRDALNMPKEYTFYSWKHTGLVETDESRVPMKEKSLQAGHQSIRTTEIYFRNKKPAVSQNVRNNWADL